MRFELSRLARRQVDRIHGWWTDNRPSARSMFLADLARAQQLLCEAPELGIVFATHKTGVVRRLLLSNTDYHLYYQYRRDRNEIFVLRVHGATRGHQPR
ncbi:MAG TPA: type II toxin-antitoxin system RelE/ParE family toxin [Kofleriaceae bacterium]|nr:type II toxin-antitoxin system RelE/ParE family toxin [Kofleriaceae bacterium]